MSARILLFVGKGGVGKSTCSSLVALKLARAGRRVLLNSIDPAHNLHDIFRVPLGARPRRIVPGLQAVETNLDHWVKRYLKETENDFRSVYKYQEAFNLHRYFRILKYSPGLEEYAVLLALVDTLRRFADRDYIIFDTPPTALTLRFLALPEVSLLWLKELSQFRELILAKKEIITRVKEGRREDARQRDPILAKIAGLLDLYRGLSELLKDGRQSRAFLVLNPDELSLAESRLIWKELTRLRISIPFVIVNKAEEGRVLPADPQREFSASRVVRLPRVEGAGLTGIERLDSLRLPIELEAI